MKDLVRFGAGKYDKGDWLLGFNIIAHSHGEEMKHALFVLNLGWWYLEMEIGYEPQD